MSPMKPIVQTEAFVLSTKDYGESDRLITFYTRREGKLRGVAKGARKSRKRFANVFEPCSLVDLSYRARGALTWIEACKLLEPHGELRMDIERWAYAALLCEIMLEMLPEGDPQEELFSLFQRVLERLSYDADPLNVVMLFFLRFMDMAGLLPSLDVCHICKQPLKAHPIWWWRIEEGVLFCREHNTGGGGEALRLDAGSMVVIQQARGAPIEKMWRFHFRQDKKEHLFHALVAWATGHIHKELKSLKLLKQLRST